MKKKVFEEFLEKVKQAKSQAEIEAAAKACCLELTAEQLTGTDDALQGANGELTDEELDGVAGGKKDLEYGTPEFWHYVDEQIQKYGPSVVPALMATYMQ